jgi:hypothetical protein
VLAHFRASAVRQPVKAQTIDIEIDFLQKVPFERLELGDRDLAFEYRLLNALANAFANSRNTSQAAASSARFGVDVIANDHKH